MKKLKKFVDVNELSESNELEQMQYELSLEMERNEKLFFETLRLKTHINKLSSIIVDLTNEKK